MIDVRDIPVVDGDDVHDAAVRDFCAGRVLSIFENKMADASTTSHALSHINLYAVPHLIAATTRINCKALSYLQG